MIDVASLVIEINRLVRETYEEFNNKEHDKALANAALLKAASKELHKLLKNGR